MKSSIKKTACQNQIFTAFVLTTILSVDMNLGGMNKSAASSIVNPDSSSILVKQGRNSSLPNSVVNEVRNAIARTTTTSPEQWKVVSFSQKSWSDSCLGLGLPHESCLQVLIENGWRVVMSNGQEKWVARSDASGELVRLENQNNPYNYLPQSVIDGVKKAASERSGVKSELLNVIQVRQIQTNGCLNLPRPREGCTKINMPAWEITVNAKPQHLVYRSDRRGTQIRFDGQATNIANTNVPNAVANAVVQKASQDLRLPASAIRVIKAQRSTWSSGCDRPTFPYPCDQVLESGWQVFVNAGSKSATYRSNESGSQIKVERITK